MSKERVVFLDRAAFTAVSVLFIKAQQRVP